MRVASGSPASRGASSERHGGAGAGDGLAARWADALADVVTRYALLAGSGSKCITVVDLSPPDLEAAWLLRRRVNRIGDLLRGAGMGLCYLPCPQPGGPAASARSEAGEGFLLRWDASHPRVAPRLHPTGESWQPEGPVVVVASDTWSQLRQQVAAVHYGKVFEWRGQGDAAEWERRDVRAFPPDAPGSLQPYLDGLNSFVFSLPLGALAALKSIPQWAPRGYLVVARGEGWADDKSLRLPDPAMMNAQRLREMDLPVNFHWLATHCKRSGALPLQVNVPGREVIQLVMGGHGATPDRLAAIGQVIESATVSGATQLARGVRVFSEAGDTKMALALLRQSGWDADVFSRSGESLAATLARGGDFNKVEWAAALRRIWDNRLEPRRDTAFLRGIARAALACADADLARRAGELLAGQAVRPDDLLIQAECLEQTGSAVEALAACEEALGRGARPTQAMDVRTRLRARLTRRGAPWLLPFERQGSALILEPLDAHHAAAFCHQYRDPQIAVMTGLPELASVAKTVLWIEGKNAKESASYAVVHRELGFVGSCELCLNDHGGFLCFWIGTDFQGMRFASEAASMACEFAFRNGVTVVWSSVFDDNVRSLRALRRAGFAPVGIRARAPHDERTFLYLANRSMASGEAVRGLVSYCGLSNPALDFGEPGQPLHGVSSAELSSELG